MNCPACDLETVVYETRGNRRRRRCSRGHRFTTYEVLAEDLPLGNALNAGDVQAMLAMLDRMRETVEKAQAPLVKTITEPAPPHRKMPARRAHRKQQPKSGK